MPDSSRLQTSCLYNSLFATDERPANATLVIIVNNSGLALSVGTAKRYGIRLSG
jgi:hypothetical protein